MTRECTILYKHVSGCFYAQKSGVAYDGKGDVTLTKGIAMVGRRIPHEGKSVSETYLRKMQSN